MKKLVFSIVRKTLNISKMDADFDACDVDLNAVLVWAIREQRLFSCDTEDLEFNIKLDGRPLGGMNYIILVYRLGPVFYFISGIHSPNFTFNRVVILSFYIPSVT